MSPLLLYSQFVSLFCVISHQRSPLHLFDVICASLWSFYTSISLFLFTALVHLVVVGLVPFSVNLFLFVVALHLFVDSL